MEIKTQLLNRFGTYNYSVIIDHKLHSQNNCFYCNCDLNDSNRTKDHLVPASMLRSQPEPIRNIIGHYNNVKSCNCCNVEKRDMTLEEYRTYMSKSPNPNRNQIMKKLNELIRPDPNL